MLWRTSQNQNLQMQKSVCSGCQKVGGQKGRMEIISCPDYKWVAIRKNLLVHRAQQLGFLQPCKPSARFSLCLPPKGIFKAEWRQLSFFVVLILPQSQMLLLCKPLVIIFALKYFPGFPFAVTVLSLLLGAGTVSFLGHKCFLLSTENLPSSYCAPPVYYGELQPHPAEFALILLLFLLFLIFSQLCFSYPRSIIAVNSVRKFSCLIHSLQSHLLILLGFPHPSTSAPVPSVLHHLFCSQLLALALSVSFASSACWILN